MSKVAGHYWITRRAIEELKAFYVCSLVIQDIHLKHGGTFTPPERNEVGTAFSLTPRRLWVTGIDSKLGEMMFGEWYLAEMKPLMTDKSKTEDMCDESANFADGAGCIDLEHALDGSHWEDKPEAQGMHFMKASEQVTSYPAYKNALSLIKKNIETAAALIFAASRQYNLSSACNARAEWKPHKGRVTSKEASKFLGRALHTVQDSFSPSHVVRNSYGDGPESPGEILAIHQYKGQNTRKHAESDDAWLDDTSGDFTAKGRQAINASKELIRLAERMAMTGNVDANKEPGWAAYCERWLRFGGPLVQR